MPSPRGFTLVELMISIALVLVLMVGVNYVFQKTADAVSAGNTTNTFSRDSQSAQAVLFDDFNHVNKNPPCFIIASQIVDQFLNAPDAQSGSDPSLVVVDNAGNTLPIITGLYNYRCHRTDLVKFFVRGNYQRRSANDGSFTSQTTSQDAFVTLGHALLPTNDSSNFVGPVNDNPAALGPLGQFAGNVNPGLWTPQVNTTAAGPQQRLGAYAADWVLARSLVLLKDQSTNVNATDTAFTEHCYPRYPNTIAGAFAGPPYPAPYPYTANMTPLAYYSPDDQFNSTTSSSKVMQSSRYDLACITPDQFRRAIADEILQYRNAGYTGANPHLWWNPLIYSLPITVQNSPTAPVSASAAVSYYTIPPMLAYPGLYTFNGANLSGAAGAAAPQPNPDLARVAANPQIQTPLTSAMVGQIAPYFLQHCSQFIVEYAGDYLTQDPASGNLTGIGPDGQIDYYLDANGNKQIRWYGMPRSNSNSAVIYGVPNPSDTGEPWSTYLPNQAFLPSPPNVSIAINYRAGTPSYPGLPDVIPLRDYYSLYYNTLYGTTTTPAVYSPPWETDVNFDFTWNYAANPTTSNANGLQNSFHINDIKFPQYNARYVAAWYNDMPAMVRILIKVDDPNDKLKDGPWFVYVFKLK